MLRKLGLSALSLGAAYLVGAVSPVMAQEPPRLFANLQPAYKERVFWRLNTVYASTKTKSGDAYDVTGNVIDLATLQAMNAALQAIDTNPSTTSLSAPDRAVYARLKAQYGQAIVGLSASGTGVRADDPNATGLGTPRGIKARAGNGATLAFSVGVFLDDKKSWAAEALLLGLPMDVSVYGDGVTQRGTPNGLSGKEIIKTKLLPPTAILGRYFGDQNSAFRPYAGVGAMYAVFFDTKPTAELNAYQGGQSLSDTSVSIKNAFGVGPFLGIEAKFGDGWQARFNIGHVRLKTEATLITKNTVITSTSAVTKDYGPNVTTAIEVGDGFDSTTVGGAPLYPNGFTTRLMSDYANYKATGAVPGPGVSGTATLGTFVRKQKTTLDNTIMMLSVGREF